MIRKLSPATKTAVKLANKIVSSSSRPEIRSLLVELTDTLTETTQAHYNAALVASRFKTVPTKHFPYVSATYDELVRQQVQQYETDQKKDGVVLVVADDDNDNDDKKKTPLSFSNATYGETPPATISTILNVLSEHNGNIPFQGHFVDAGSGRGGALVCAALEGLFDHCRGVEYDEDHSTMAMALGKQYDDLLQKNSTTRDEEEEKKSGDGDEDNNTISSSPPPPPTTTIRFVCGDLKHEQDNGGFQGASVVYSNSVVFDSDLCSMLGNSLDQADLLRPGAFVVTITRRFSMPSFDLVDVLRLPCNGGGDFTFYVSQKRGDNDEDEEGRDSSRASSSSFLAAPAIYDSDSMRELRRTDNTTTSSVSTDARATAGTPSSSSSMMEKLVLISLQEGGLEGLAFLTALGASEPNVRLLSKNSFLLDSLGASLSLQDAGTGGPDLQTRASTSMVLRAIASYPIGRRTIAEHGALMDSIFTSLARRKNTNDEDDDGSYYSCPENDHLVVRANIADIVGEVIHDHVGNAQVGDRDIDSVVGQVFENVSHEERGFDMLKEACDEIKAMRRWRLGGNRIWSETIEKDIMDPIEKRAGGSQYY